MRHLFSVLLFVATLIGTSSFMYETTSTTRAENISLQTQKKYKGRKACKHSKARKPSVHKKKSTRYVKVGRVCTINGDATHHGNGTVLLGSVLFEVEQNLKRTTHNSDLLWVTKLFIVRLFVAMQNIVVQR